METFKYCLVTQNKSVVTIQYTDLSLDRVTTIYPREFGYTVVFFDTQIDLLRHLLEVLEHED